MDALPTELCLKIADLLRDGSYSNLKSLALTSRRLASVAQAAMYADIEVAINTSNAHRSTKYMEISPARALVDESIPEIKEYTPFDALHATIMSRPSYFGPMIQSLHVLDYPSWNLRIISSMDLTKLFSALPNLHRLTAQQFVDCFERGINCIYTPEAVAPIATSLTCFECSGYFELSDLASVLKQMTNLVKLTIDFSRISYRDDTRLPGDTASTEIVRFLDALRYCGTHIQCFSVYGEPRFRPPNRVMAAHSELALSWAIRFYVLCFPRLQILWVHDKLAVRSHAPTIAWPDPVAEVDEEDLPSNILQFTELRTIVWVGSFTYFDPQASAQSPGFNKAQIIFQKADSVIIPKLFSLIPSLYEVKYYSHRSMHLYDANGGSNSYRRSEPFDREDLKNQLRKEWPVLYRGRLN